MAFRRVARLAARPEEVRESLLRWLGLGLLCRRRGRRRKRLTALQKAVYLLVYRLYIELD
jgi:transposase InsO family protein